MRKWLFLAFFGAFLAFPVNLWAWSLFDGLYKKIDDNSTKTYKVMDNLANEIAPIKDNQIGLINKLDKLDMKLSAMAQAQASAIAGVNNKVSNLSSGRDTIQTTTNDTDLLKFIFDKWYLVIAGLFSFILALLGGVWGIMKYQSKMFYRIIAEKDKRIERESESRARKEQRLDEWQSRMIERLVTKGEKETDELLKEAEREVEKK